MKQTMKDFIIEDYGKKSVFASFLPGISGVRGIPIWCYYVNRGQAVVSFGVENKDHAIMEFYPAHQAYQNVKTTGFRTFVRMDGQYFEAFAEEKNSQTMRIGANRLSLMETHAAGFQTTVDYYALPGEKTGALVRRVGIRNLTAQAAEFEVLDGMPAVVPYGVDMDSMKSMGQTSKAWMQAERLNDDVWYYRVRASMDDTADVHEILGGNFASGCLADGTGLPVYVDPELVFGYDTSLHTAAGFLEKGLAGMEKEEQITQNQLPCAFFALRRTLAPKEELVWYELIGQVESKAVLKEFLAEKRDGAYFARKQTEAQELTERLCLGIATRTANEDFDAYCKYTYMDNVLRGGYPMKLGNNKVFYVYSRKHGDLERDYNYFSMLPEFYSQGNGNFRDVNQNRRCDTFFAPFVGAENIREFYSLIQLDGYNPLGVEKLTYELSAQKAQALFADLDRETAQQLTAFTTKPFTPGSLYRKLDALMQGAPDESLFLQIIDFADSLVNGNFGEGYWSDHWTYNLDLIEDYLEIFPEKEQELLWGSDYTWFLSQKNVNRRTRRYEVTPRGLRQYHALNEQSARCTKEKLVRTNYGKGEVWKSTLIEKLLLLCAAKFATLDAYGMGVEMEGGKPGWYDALNGMPGMFGSSMAETYELCRMLTYVADVLARYPGTTAVYSELACFLDELHLINRVEKQQLETQDEVLDFWNRINDAKELYRDKSYEGISGEKTVYRNESLYEMIKGYLGTVQKGIQKALKLGGGICPTYFTYEVPEYEQHGDEIKPLHFNVQPVPHFLEGPVRYFKLKTSAEDKKRLYENIRHSDLYDTKLRMYKVNESLQNASFELGRARAFTPGWLENESIWLHMEYKYLLELLRSGLYEQFFADFHAAAVPFLDAHVYGRSIYENSSFIASSKNPDRRCHGKGFVARLSGSTVEFISMWKCMMFGRHIFEADGGEPVFAPQPALPAYLIPQDGQVEAMLLGSIETVYHFAQVRDYYPGNYEITQIKLIYRNGSVASVCGARAGGQPAQDIRSGKVARIEITVS